MVDSVGINTHVYVLGTTGDPVAYYYADSSKTITVALYDINGGAIGSSTSYNASAGLNTFNLGDYLNTLTLSEGFYVLKIGDYNFTIVVTNGSISTPTGNVERILVMHKATGLIAELPKTAPVIPYSDGFMVAVYMHDNSKKQGRLVFYDGLNEYDTGWLHKAIIRLEVSFPDYNTMYQYIIAHLNDVDSGSINAVGAIANSNVSDAIKVIGLYGIVPLLGTVINYSIDIDNKKMTIEVVERLGYGFDNIKKALYVIGGGALAIAGIGAGIALSVSTGGVGSALGIAVAGASIATGLYVMSRALTDSPEEEQSWLGALDNKYRDGVSNVTEAKDDALSTLDYYHDNGQVSDEAYNALKQKILDLYNTSIKVIKELYEISKNCFEAGKRSVESKKYMYAGIGALGGLLADRILGRIVK